MEESYKKRFGSYFVADEQTSGSRSTLRGWKFVLCIRKVKWGIRLASSFLYRQRIWEKVYNIMNSMDYEQQVNRTNHGRLYFRVPGIRVIFYDEIPLGNEILYKHLTHAAQKVFSWKQEGGDKELEFSMQFLYQFGRWVDAYMMGN